jgi:hypothetical protein
MRPDDVQIYTDDPDLDCEFVGIVKAKVGAAVVFSKAPTLEDVNFRLQEEAIKVGANAVIKVEYRRGATATSWKGLTATGVAVRVLSDETTCPLCAETIKRAAVRCKHCGADLSTAA